MWNVSDVKRYLFHVKRFVLLSVLNLYKTSETSVKAICINAILQLRAGVVQFALYVLYCLLSPIHTGLSPVLQKMLENKRF